MTDELMILCGTAAWVGFLHTLLGPDHYVPFVAMSRAGGWSPRKTIAVTLACGAGHVLSSVVLGIIGIAVGIAVFHLEDVEAFRGAIAGWLLLAFGAVYFVWGIRGAIRNKPHVHAHAHANGTVHEHNHMHHGGHVHVHDKVEARDSSGEDASRGSVSGVAPVPPSLKPWVLFTIFVFGPCELLIPMLMYPAAKGQWWEVAIVTSVFAVTTLTTMTAAVVLALYAARPIRLGRFERFGHAMAGFVIMLCGTMVTLGW